jgi:hypothetical protein
MTGAYVGTDLFNRLKPDSIDIKFAEEVLKFNLGTGHAAKTGNVYSVPSHFKIDSLYLDFNVELNDSIYAVEAPDEINPFGGSETILRYSENHFSAGTCYKKDFGVIVLGFPFETIVSKEMRDILMNLVLNYLLK